jgi:hypothetical protein
VRRVERGSENMHAFWAAGCPEVNFGDYIIEALPRRLGDQAVDFTVGKPPLGEPILVVINPHL